MPLYPHNPLDDLEKERQKQIDMINKISKERTENSEPLQYEDTFLKDVANDIISSQKQIETKLDDMILENAKSGKKSACVAFLTLIIGLLTLIATIVGIIMQSL